jgi:hypothetical protein
MAGDGPTVIAAAEKLRGLIPDEVARGIALRLRHKYSERGRVVPRPRSLWGYNGHQLEYHLKLIRDAGLIASAEAQPLCVSQTHMGIIRSSTRFAIRNLGEGGSRSAYRLYL